MSKRIAMVVLAIFAVASLTSAAEFPLKQVKLDAAEAMSTPGGNGALSQLLTKKPEAVKNEPKAKSEYPLYGTLPVDKDTQIAFRLDESKGSETGYDILIVDLNRNGDLTDDPVAKTASEPPKQGQSFERSMFGPIEVAADQAQGQWRPSLCAQINVYNRQAIKRGGRMAYVGYLQARPGGYLESTVDLNGIKQKIAFLDGSCNMKLGEPAIFEAMSRGSEVYWNLPFADAMLRDVDGSGKFETGTLDLEADTLSSIVYFGDKPYEVSLAEDFSKVSFEPYKGSVGELVVGKDQSVSALILGREIAKGKWEAVSPDPTVEKIKVPEGRYRMYACVVSAKDKEGATVSAMGMNRTAGGIVEVKSGAGAQLACGAPIDLKVQAKKSGSSSGGILGSLIGSGPTSQISINVEVAGAGGEVYSQFMKTTKRGYTQPSPPKFKVLDDQGKQIASGQLEYG